MQKKSEKNQFKIFKILNFEDKIEIPPKIAIYQSLLKETLKVLG